MQAASRETGAWAKSLTFAKTAAVQAVGAFGGFMFMSAVINSVTQGFQFLKDAVLEFDTAIVESMAVMSEQGPAVRSELEATAQAVAKGTKFNSTEVAEGFYHLISAGYDLNQTLALTPIVAAYAQAGVMNLEEATEQLAQTQAALGMKSEDPVQNMENMTRISDALAQAAVKSTASVKDFGDMITNKFGTAIALSGRTVEEAMTLGMAYANVGIKGKVAGTQLSVAMRDLQLAAVNNSAAMEDLGINVYDANGNMNNLVEIAKSLNTAFGSMSDKGLRMKLKSLGFADRAVHAILPLIATSTAEWEKNEAAMAGAAGAAQRMSDKQMKSLTAQLGNVRDVAQEVAVALGKKMLNGAAELWKSLEKPIKDVVNNLKDFAKEAALPAFEPLVALIGGGFVLSLQIIAQALKGITSALAGLGPAVKPLLTFAVTLKGVSLLFGPLAASAQVYAVRLGLITTAQMENAVATKFATAAMEQQATARAAATAAATAQAGGVAQAAFIGPMLPTGKGMKLTGIVASLNGAKAAAISATAGMGKLTGAMHLAKLGAVQLRAAINLIGTGTAIGIAVAAFVAAGVVIHKEIQSYRELAREHNDRVNEGLVMTDPADREKALKNQRDYIEAMKKERDKAWDENEGLNPWSGLQNAWTTNAASKVIDESENILKADEAKYDLYEERLARMARIAGTTKDVVRAKVDAMGIGPALMDAGAKSEEYSEIQKNVTSSLEGVATRAAGASVEVEALAASEEDGTAAAEAMAKRYEEIAKVLFEGMDPTKILSDLQKINEAIAGSFGATGASVLGDLQSAADDALQAAADLADKNDDKSIEARVEALQDEKDALDDGTKSTKASKAAIKDRKKAIDDEIEAVKDSKKEKEDPAPAVIGLDAWANGLQKASEDTKALTDNLQLIKQKMRDAKIPESVIQDTVSNLAAMGAEGAPLIESFAKLGEDRFGQMAIKISESFKGINPEIATSLADFDAAMAGSVAKADAQIVGLKDIAGSLAKAGMGTTPDDLLNFAKLGPEAMALLPEMATKAASGQQGAMEVAGTIRNALTNAGILDGTIVAMLTEELAMAQLIAVTPAEQLGSTINQAINGKMIPTPGEMSDALAAKGFSNAATWASGYQLFLDNWKAEYFPEPQNVTNGSSRAAGTPSKPGGTGGKRPPPSGGGQSGGRTTLNGIDPNPNGGIDGNIWTTFASGGIKENHKAQIARAGDMRLWAEPETGGEAYIPLGSNKRSDAMPVLAEVARRFGLGLSQYANGGVRPAGYDMVGAGRHGTGNSAQTTVVAVPIESKNITQFNGPIQGVRMEDAEAYAARKRRQARLAGGRKR
jgi:TP901 family phage tail tape measure protein